MPAKPDAGQAFRQLDSVRRDGEWIFSAILRAPRMNHASQTCPYRRRFAHYHHPRRDVVGRGRNLCDVLLQQTCISKLQCLIAKTDGLLFIRDLGSTNGTKVNGQRVTRGPLAGRRAGFRQYQISRPFGTERPGGGGGRRERADRRHQSPGRGSGEEYGDFDSQELDPGQSNSDVRLLSDDSAVS